MAQSNRASSRVKLFLWHAELLHAVGGLASEGFVDLENVDIINLQSCILQCCWDGQCGTNTHNMRRHTSNGKANDSAVNLASEFFSHISAS